MSKVNSARLRAQSQSPESKLEKLKKSSIQGDSQTWPKKPLDNMSTVQRKQKTNGCNQGHTQNNGHRGQTAASVKSRDLSQDDLLFLLSMLEGELQARDEVITVLKAEKTDLALLESQYGFVTPQKVLQALQRDTIQGKSCGRKEDIYEKPIVELDKLMEKQRETYRQMLEQVLMVEQAHKQSLYRLEDEKRNHSEYMKKSDEFTNLLEQERERLKLVIDQEKVYQERKEEENSKKITSLKDELTKLKSFALLVIDEQQRATEQLAQHTAKVQELQTAATKAQDELISARNKAQELESKVFSLEAELLDQASRFKQEQDAMTAKLTNEDSQNRQLRQKLSVLSRQLDELEESNKTLRRAEEELQDLREKISHGECGNPSLVSEVEELRKRVLEMEGKDEELIKMEDMCRDLNRKLEKESNQSRSLKAEVDKLNHRIMELEKLEDAFGKSKQECNSLKCNLEKERTVTKHMSSELDGLRVRIKELEAAEGQLEKTEWTLKEDLAKLKTLTVMLVDERKTMAEKLKQLEDKVQNSTDKLHAEQDKVTLVTEKLIGESKKSLRSKAELEDKMCIAFKERDELKTKLKVEQDKNNDLQSKVNMMKKRLQSLEAVEIEFLRNKSKEENTKASVPNHFQLEDNKVKYLTQEVERLKSKLKERNVVEDGRMKTEDVCESLEKRYSNEQQRAKALMEELELSQKELSNYQLVEKENSNQHALYMHLREEEAKSSELTKEVEALKETIHKYMGTEETICHMKTEHATLRRKLTQQEIRNKELAREMETLTRELERYRRFSKSLRPGMNGRRFSDLHVSTKEVQTEPTDSFSPNYKNLALLERAVVNGKLYEDSDNEDEPSYNEINLMKCSPSLLNNITNLDNNTKQTRSPLLKTRENQQPINDKTQARQSRSQIQQGDKFVTHSPGQPLHIKVTPDHNYNTATLEITSPTGDKGQSYTTTAVIPTTGAPPKQRITIIQNSPVSPHNHIKGSPSTESPCTPDGSASPLATYSHRGTPEFRSVMTPERAMSPTETVSITTEIPDRTHPGETVEITAGHTVVCLTPQKSNSWQLQRSNSTGPNVITTEDNKIHIHFGHPYIQTMNQPVSPCKSPSQEQKSPVINSAPVKGNNKIASSIMIKPTSSPIPQPSQITIPLEAFRQSGPTKIPKPKGCCSKTGTNTIAVPADNKGIPPAPLNFGKNVSNNLNMLDIPANS